MTEKHPYLDAALRGWIVTTANKEFWRMPSWYKLQDLIQDGYLCYAKCWARYADEVQTYPTIKGHPAVPFNVPNPTKAQRVHFMSLVQRTYYNYIMTLAGKTAKLREDPVDDTIIDRLIPPLEGDGDLLAVLAKMPTELAEAAEKLIMDGLDGHAYLRKRQLTMRGKKVVLGPPLQRETSSERMDRVLGVHNVRKRLLALI